jgi:hypothetical protein
MPGLWVTPPRGAHGGGNAKKEGGRAIEARPPVAVVLALLLSYGTMHAKAIWFALIISLMLSSLADS